MFLPGGELEEDEELVCDSTAYMVQAEVSSMNQPRDEQFTTEWPCLSFDIVHEGPKRDLQV